MKWQQIWQVIFTIIFLVWMFLVLFLLWRHALSASAQTNSLLSTLVDVTGKSATSAKEAADAARKSSEAAVKALETIQSMHFLYSDGTLKTIHGKEEEPT